MKCNNLIITIFMLMSGIIISTIQAQKLKLYTKSNIYTFNISDIDSIVCYMDDDILSSPDIETLLTSSANGWWQGESNYVGGDISLKHYDFDNNNCCINNVYLQNDGTLQFYEYANYQYYLASDKQSLFLGSVKYNIDSISYNRISLSANNGDLLILFNNKTESDLINILQIDNEKYRFYGKTTNMEEQGMSLYQNVFFVLTDVGFKQMKQCTINGYDYSDLNVISLATGSSFFDVLIDEMYYDEVLNRFYSADGCIFYGYRPGTVIFDLDSHNDTLRLGMCGSQFQEAFSNLNTLFHSRFSTYSDLHIGWGKSSESGSNAKSGLILMCYSLNNRIDMGIKGSINYCGPTIVISFDRDENGELDTSNNLNNPIRSIEGFAEALNIFVSLFEGEFKKIPTDWNLPSDLFKLVSSSDSNNYITWQLK